MKSTPTIDQIYSHYSVRSYKPDPVPCELIEKIVAAGQRASSSSNLQTYSVVAVMDHDRKARLRKLCGDQEHIEQAPVFLAWCADLSRLERVCQARGYEQVSEYAENFLIAAVDATLAMQNAALAAESLGLGMCYIGGIRNHPQEVIDLLGLPMLVFPITGMTLGWPDVTPHIRPRLPLRTILHWERYDTTGEKEALHEYDRTMITTGIYSGRQVSVPEREGEMEDYGWQEHSARRVSQLRRPGLRDALVRQGFLLE